MHDMHDIFCSGMILSLGNGISLCWHIFHRNPGSANPRIEPPPPPRPAHLIRSHPPAPLSRLPDSASIAVSQRESASLGVVGPMC